MRELYSKLRNEREKTTFSMMMKMNPEALTAVRKEFFMREDKVELPEFIYIIQKHLSGGTASVEDDIYSMETNEKREFGLNMCELFKEIDVNGDGDLEWQVSNILLFRMILIKPSCPQSCYVSPPLSSTFLKSVITFNMNVMTNLLRSAAISIYPCYSHICCLLFFLLNHSDTVFYIYILLRRNSRNLSLRKRIS